MNNERGFILVLTFILMIVLIAAAGGLLYMVSNETKDVGVQRDDINLINLAEAGVQKAMRVIRDDVLSTTQTGTAYIRGADTSASVNAGGATDFTQMRYFDGTSTVINNVGDDARLRTFDTNYVNARIVSIFLGARASRQTGGTGATLQVSYSTTGVFPQVGSTNLTVVLPNSATLASYTQNVTADRTWTWSIITNSNFALRAIQTAGNRNINLDAIYLIVTYEIDTNTEPWFTGSYATFPITLGSGTIQSISITDEQGKVHLNYATQSLLRFLMEERGVVSATANTVATNIVNYRGATLTNPFDSVEELLQVTGMTQAIYDAIKDYVTVYSFVNTNVTRPPAVGTTSRAPININTASREVLEAIFDPLPIGVTDAASLATDIINTRAVTPFTCFYSGDALVTTDFYDFVNSRAYLTAAERNAVLDNADASFLAPVAGTPGVDGVTTEFSYDTNAFKVESLADVFGRRYRIKTILGDNGSRTFTTFSGDTSSIGYQKENFE